MNLDIDGPVVQKMVEKQSKRTERLIRLNLAKRSLSLVDEQDLRDIKRQRVKQNRISTSDFEQVRVRDNHLPDVHFDFTEASGIISEASDGDEFEDSIRNEDSSDESLTSEASDRDELENRIRNEGTCSSDESLTSVTDQDRWKLLN